MFLPVNTPAPGFIKLFYEGIAGQHTAVYNCKPRFVGFDFELERRPGAGSPIPWAIAISALVTVMRPLVPTTTTFQYAELWTQELNGNAQWRATLDIALAGTGGASPFAQGTQLVLTTRTSNGGRAQFYIMGASAQPNLLLRPPTYGNTARRDWADYITGNATWLTGRDDGYPSVGVRMLTKTNDALRRRRNRTGLG